MIDSSSSTSIILSKFLILQNPKTPFSMPSPCKSFVKSPPVSELAMFRPMTYAP